MQIFCVKSESLNHSYFTPQMPQFQLTSFCQINWIMIYERKLQWKLAWKAFSRSHWRSVQANHRQEFEVPWCVWKLKIFVLRFRIRVFIISGYHWPLKTLLSVVTCSLPRAASDSLGVWPEKHSKSLKNVSFVEWIIAGSFRVLLTSFSLLHVSHRLISEV